MLRKGDSTWTESYEEHEHQVLGCRRQEVPCFHDDGRHRPGPRYWCSSPRHCHKSETLSPTISSSRPGTNIQLYLLGCIIAVGLDYVTRRALNNLLTKHKQWYCFIASASMLSVIYSLSFSLFSIDSHSMSMQQCSTITKYKYK